MRLALVAVLLLAVATPLAASARMQNPVVCRRIATQLVHYDAMKSRAADAGHDLWVDRFGNHLARLEDDFADKCPEQAAEQRSIQQLSALLKSAGRAALTFFTLGMY